MAVPTEDPTKGKKPVSNENSFIQPMPLADFAKRHQPDRMYGSVGSIDPSYNNYLKPGDLTFERLANGELNLDRANAQGGFWNTTGRFVGKSLLVAGGTLLHTAQAVNPTGQHFMASDLIGKLMGVDPTSSMYSNNGAASVMSGNFLGEFGDSLIDAADTELPTYRRDPQNPYDMTDGGWWVDNMSSLTGSILGNLGPRGLIVKGLSATTRGVTNSLVRGATKNITRRMASGVDDVADAANLAKYAKYKNFADKWLPIAGTAGIESATESLAAGRETYNNVYQSSVDRYTQMYNNGEIDEQQLQQNVEQAKVAAGNAAARTFGINMLTLPLNMTLVSPFLKGYNKLITRGAEELNQSAISSAAKIGIRSKAKNYLREAGQEAAEEETALFASKLGQRYGREEAGLENNEEHWWDTMTNALFSQEGFTTGFLGAIGGVGMQGGTNALRSVAGTSTGQQLGLSGLSYDAERARIAEASNFIQQGMGNANTLLGASTIKGVKENLKTNEELQSFIKATGVSDNLGKLINKAYDDGNDVQYEYLSRKMMDVAHQRAYMSGTTDSIEKMYDGVINNQNTPDDIKDRAKLAKDSLLKGEINYIHAVTKYGNNDPASIAYFHDLQAVEHTNGMIKQYSDFYNTLRKELVQKNGENVDTILKNAGVNSVTGEEFINKVIDKFNTHEQKLDSDLNLNTNEVLNSKLTTRAINRTAKKSSDENYDPTKEDYTKEEEFVNSTIDEDEDFAKLDPTTKLALKSEVLKILPDAIGISHYANTAKKQLLDDKILADKDLSDWNTTDKAGKTRDAFKANTAYEQNKAKSNQDKATVASSKKKNNTPKSNATGEQNLADVIKDKNSSQSEQATVVDPNSEGGSRDAVGKKRLAKARAIEDAEDDEVLDNQDSTDEEVDSIEDQQPDIVNSPAIEGDENSPYITGINRTFTPENTTTENNREESKANNNESDEQSEYIGYDPDTQKTDSFSISTAPNRDAETRIFKQDTSDNTIYTQRSNTLLPGTKLVFRIKDQPGDTVDGLLSELDSELKRKDQNYDDDKLDRLRISAYAIEEDGTETYAGNVHRVAKIPELVKGDVATEQNKIRNLRIDVIKALAGTYSDTKTYDLNQVALYSTVKSKSGGKLMVNVQTANETPTKSKIFDVVGDGYHLDPRTEIAVIASDAEAFALEYNPETKTRDFRKKVKLDSRKTTKAGSFVVYLPDTAGDMFPAYLTASRFTDLLNKENNTSLADAIVEMMATKVFAYLNADTERKRKNLSKSARESIAQFFFTQGEVGEQYKQDGKPDTVLVINEQIFSLGSDIIDAEALQEKSDEGLDPYTWLRDHIKANLHNPDTTKYFSPSVKAMRDGIKLPMLDADGKLSYAEALDYLSVLNDHELYTVDFTSYKDDLDTEGNQLPNQYFTNPVIQYYDPTASQVSPSESLSATEPTDAAKPVRRFSNKIVDVEEATKTEQNTASINNALQSFGFSADLNFTKGSLDPISADARFSTKVSDEDENAYIDSMESNKPNTNVFNNIKQELEAEQFITSPSNEQEQVHPVLMSLPYTQKVKAKYAITGEVNGVITSVPEKYQKDLITFYANLMMQTIDKQSATGNKPSIADSYNLLKNFLTHSASLIDPNSVEATYYKLFIDRFDQTTSPIGFATVRSLVKLNLEAKGYYERSTTYAAQGANAGEVVPDQDVIIEDDSEALNDTSTFETSFEDRSGESSFSDDRTFQIDPKKGASAAIRRMLSYVKKLNVQKHNGKPVWDEQTENFVFLKDDNGNQTYVTNTMGIPEYIDYNTMFDALSRILYDKDSFAGMLEEVKKLGKYGMPEAVAVYDTLSKAPEQVQKEFFTHFSQQYNEFHTLLWNPSESGNGNDFNRVVENRSGSERIIFNQWLNNFMQSEVITTENGVLRYSGLRKIQGQFIHGTINNLNENALRLSTELKETKGWNVTAEQKERTVDLLNRIGINLSIDSLEVFVSQQQETLKAKTQSKIYSALNNKRGRGDRNFKSYSDWFDDMSNIFKSLVTNQNKTVEEFNPFLTKQSDDADSGKDSKAKKYYDTQRGRIEALARMEVNFQTNLLSNSFRLMGQPYFSFSRPNMATNTIRDVTNSTDKRNELLQTAFSKRCPWLNQLNVRTDDGTKKTSFARFFRTGIARVMKRNIKGAKGVETKQFVPVEQEIHRINLLAGKPDEFTAKGEESTMEGGNTFIAPTISDKTLPVDFVVNRIPVTFENGKITGVAMEALRNCALSEIDRMIAIREHLEGALDKSEWIENLHYTKNDRDGKLRHGLGNHFVIMDFLNGLVDSKDSEGNDILGLFTAQGWIKNDIDNRPDLTKVLDDAINNHFTKLMDLKAKAWVNDGILTNLKAIPSETPYIGKDYLVKARNFIKKYNDANTKIDLEEGNRVLLPGEYLALDYEINNYVNHVSFRQMFGDPAAEAKVSYNKKTKEFDLYGSISSTWDNVRKRNTKITAPGTQADVSDSDYLYYKQVILADKLVDISTTETFARYEQILTNKYAADGMPVDQIADTVADVLSPYREINEGDAQEYVTVYEMLNHLINTGQISREKAGLPKKVEVKQEIDGVTQTILDTQTMLKNAPTDGMYYRLQTGSETDADTSVVLQAQKPVYAGLRFIGEGNNKLAIPIYIKSSAFALIPTLTKGTELDKLRNAMERDDIARAAYTSANKSTLAGNKVQSIYDEVGSIHNDLSFASTTKHQVMDRRNFRIQQDVNEGKTKITTGTQARTLLWIDMVNNPELMALKQQFDQVAVQMIVKDFHKLAVKQGAIVQITQTDEGPKEQLRIANTSKFRDLLLTEVYSRNLGVVAEESLAVDGEGNFLIPTQANPMFPKFESLLLSIVQNTVIKAKMPGTSGVLASEAGFKVAKEQTISNTARKGIKWIAEPNTDGSLKSNQILISSWFKGSDGNLIDLTKRGNAEINQIISENLNQIFGFRIPTSGPNSMRTMEVAGFLPISIGSTVIPSRELVAAMGSDFDVDKLNMYLYNYTELDGKIVKVQESVIPLLDAEGQQVVDENGLTVFTDKALEDWSYEALQNKLIDIYLGVIKAREADMIEPITTQPLKDLANIIKAKFAGIDDKSLGVNALFSENEKKAYFDAASGKQGVAIYSLMNTALVKAQHAGLYMSKFAVVFKDEDGNVITDSQEDLQDKFLEKEAVQGVHRLDRIYSITDPGHRISTEFSMAQNASVDNAKDPLLGYLNLNRITFGVHGLITQAGFAGPKGRQYAALFLNQEAVIEAVKRLMPLGSSVDDSYDPNKEYKVFKDLFEKFGKKDSKFDGVKAYSLTEMNQALDDYISNIKEGKEPSGAYADMQAQVLYNFMEWRNLSKELRNVIAATQQDTSGIQKTFAEVNQQIIRYNNIGSNPIFANTQGLISPINKAYFDYAISQVETLYSQTLDGELITPYFLNSYTTIKDSLMGLYKINGDNSVVDLDNKINKSLLSFFYANLYDNADQIRQDLLYGDNTLARDIVGLSSNVVQANGLLKRLMPELSAKKTKPSLINFNNDRVGDEDQTKDCMFGWISLLTSADPVLQSIGKRLIDYSILVNGATTLNPRSFFKFFPPSYLVDINIKEKVNAFNDGLNNGADVKFLDEFVRTNPAGLKVDLKDSYIKPYVTKGEDKNTKHIRISGEGNIVSSVLMSNGTPIQYIKQWNSSTGNTEVFRYSGAITEGAVKKLKYTKVSLLGTSYISEWNTDKDSVTNQNMAFDVPVNVNTESFVDDSEGETENAIETNTPYSPSDYLAANLKNSKHYPTHVKELLGFFNEHIDQLKDYTVIEVNDENEDYGYHDPNVKKIVINQQSDNRLLTIIEEFTHAFVDTKIENDPVTQGRVTVLYNLAKEAINSKYQENVTKLNEELFKYSSSLRFGNAIDAITYASNNVGSLPQALIDFAIKHKEVLYPMVNKREFIARTIRSEEFRNELKTIKQTPESPKTLLDKVLDMIKGVFNSLAGKDYKGTLLEDSLETALGIIVAKPVDQEQAPVSANVNFSKQAQHDINNINSAVDGLKLIQSNLRKREKNLTPEDRSKIQQLEKDVARLSKENNYLALLKMANNDLIWIEKTLKKPAKLISNSEVATLADYIGTYNGLLAPKAFDTEFKKHSKERNRILGELLEQADKLLQVQRSKVATVALEDFKDDEHALELAKAVLANRNSDINYIEAQTLDASNNPDIIVQMIAHRLNQAEALTSLAYDDIRNNLIKVLKPFEAKYKHLGQDMYDMFRQETTDNEGNKVLTNHLVVPFGNEYYQALNTEKDKAKLKGGKSAYSNYAKWLLANTNFFVTSNIENKADFADFAANEDATKKYDLYMEDFRVIEAQGEIASKDGEIPKFVITWSNTHNPLTYLRSLKSLSNGTGTENDVKIVKNFKGWKYIQSTPTDGTTGTNDWTDPKYKAIQADPIAKDYYDFFADSLFYFRDILPTLYDDSFGRDKKTLASNFLPVLESNFFDSIAKDGLVNASFINLKDGFFNYLSEKVQPSTKVTIDPITQKPVKNIPIFGFSNRTPEDARSKDLSRVLLATAAMSLNYKYKSAMEGEIKMLRNVLDTVQQQRLNRGHLSFSKKTDKDVPVLMTATESLANTKLQVDNFINVLLYNERRKIEGVTKAKTFSSKENKQKQLLTEEIEQLEQELIEAEAKGYKKTATQIRDKIEFKKTQMDQLGSNITWGRIADVLAHQTRLRGLSGNVGSAIADTLFGIISNLVSSAERTDFNEKDILKAYGIVFSNSHKVFLDPHQDKIRNLSRKLGVDVKLLEAVKAQGKTVNRKIEEKLLDTDNLMLLHQISGSLNGHTTMVAMLLNQKLNVGGKEVNLYDTLDSTGNWDAKYGEKPEGFDELLATTSRKIVQKIVEIHGNYNANKPVLAKQYALGRLLFVFKSWIPMSLQSRFGREQYDTTSESWKAGRFKAYGVFGGEENFLRNEEGDFDWNYIKYNIIWSLGLGKSKMSDFNIRQMRKNMYGLASTATILGVILSLKSIDLEDEEDKGTITWLQNQLDKTMRDLMFFSSPKAMSSVIRDPFPVIRTVNDAIELFIKAGGYAFGEEGMELIDYTDETRRGTSKFYKYFKRNIPVVSGIDSFTSNFEELKTR